MEAYGDLWGLAERTERRNDNLVRQFHCFTEMAGVPCAMEVRDLIIDSGARPGLALFSTYNSQVDKATDVCTADTTDLKECILQLPDLELLLTRLRC